jgi:hypothetical protein
MRAIVVVATLAGAFSVSIHEARADGTWCARYPEGASNCGFYSFAQCQATVSGRAAFANKTDFPNRGGQGDNKIAFSLGFAPSSECLSKYHDAALKFSIAHRDQSGPTPRTGDHAISIEIYHVSERELCRVANTERRSP